MAIETLRHQIVSAFRQGIAAVVTEEGWELPIDKIRAEPDFAPTGDEDHLSLRLSVFNQHTSSTPDRTNAEQLIWDTRNVFRVQCVGVRAWTWLQVFIDHMLEDFAFDTFYNLGLSVWSVDDGIADVGRILSSREQYRGEVTIEVHCRTVSNRVIVEATNFQVDQTVHASGVGLQTTYTVPDDA